MMGHLNFADTWLGLILGPLVLLWALGMLWRFASPQQVGRGHAALRFSSISTLKRLKPSVSIRIRQLLHLLRIATVVLIAVAIMRPQTGKQHTKVVTEGIDIVLAIDTSGSMQALDLDAEKPLKRRRNRLEVVKGVVAKFVEKRPNDQIGVVVFGEEAFTQCPLTLDHGIVATFFGWTGNWNGRRLHRHWLGAGYGRAAPERQPSKVKDCRSFDRWTQ